MKRNQFFKVAASSTLALAATPLWAKNSCGEQMDTNLVKAFVQASHCNSNKAKALLEEHPKLINAAYDWGNGDFETGLAAASHVGNKDLVRYYLSQGAQANIFTACLFGNINAVAAMLSAFPDTLHSKGPHGLGLLHHAQQGGEEALVVKDYLQALDIRAGQLAMR